MIVNGSNLVYSWGLIRFGYELNYMYDNNWQLNKTKLSDSIILKLNKTKLSGSII